VLRIVTIRLRVEEAVVLEDIANGADLIERFQSDEHRYTERDGSAGVENGIG
jgi:hypothetical protein